MQKELAATHPSLQIQMLGINAWGRESGNGLATSNVDLPFLQDVDANEDSLSDVWESWEVVWRDVYVVDAAGEVVDIINLTTNDLNDASNYEELKDIIIETAATNPLPPPLGDCNADGSVDTSDLECVDDVEKRDSVLAELGTLPGDLDGDGNVAFADFLVLSTNFGKDDVGYVNGDIDLSGGVNFADFLLLADNFGKAS